MFCRVEYLSQKNSFRPKWLALVPTFNNYIYRTRYFCKKVIGSTLDSYPVFNYVLPCVYDQPDNGNWLKSFWSKLRLADVTVIHKLYDYVSNATKWLTWDIGVVKTYCSVIILFYFILFNLFRAGTVLIRQNLTSVDVRFWRIKTIPALKELKNL